MSKSKKMKGTTLGLSEFLSAVPDAGSSWADDDHALPSGPLGGGGGYGGPSPPTGPASRGGAPAGPTKPIPDRPPFTLYVGNLGYDVDDTALGTFFFEQGCAIVQPRVVMDRTTGMSKGFGYIEFSDRDSLLRALEFNGSQLGDRNIRLDVADAPAQAGPARGYGGFRNDAGEDRAGGASTWRRAGPVDYEPAPSRGGFGDRDRSSGFGGFGDRDRSSGGFGGFGDRDRRQGSPSRGFGGPRGESPSSARPKYGFGEGTGRARSPLRAPPSSGPTERPKLNLAPRTKPIERVAAPAAPAPEAAAAPSDAAAAPVPKKSNPFGAARPVDTVSKLKEIDEKLSKMAVTPAEDKDKEGKEGKDARAERRSGPGAPRGARGPRGSSVDKEPRHLRERKEFRWGPRQDKAQSPAKEGNDSPKSEDAPAAAEQE